jgi:hypothetical protein
VRWGFQAIQRGVASGTEGAVTRLAAKGLDLLGAAMLAVPDKCMDVSIGVAEVRALLLGTGEAFRINTLGGSSSAYYLAPRPHWSWHRPSSRRCRGGEKTGGAIVWSAGLQETVEHGALGPAWCMGRPKRESVQAPQ